ncbi:MAG: hypothetical protein PSV46_23965 [Reyranella sp.]|nr:hypothetical protein [Reyranella sp.]
MTVSIKWMLPALALLLPLALPGTASAQSNNAAYCSVLSDKYVQYLGMNQGRGFQPRSLDAQVALSKCSAADAAASIPVLEKALRGAKLELPPRT